MKLPVDVSTHDGGKLVDVALLVFYGAAFGFFLLRYAMHRRLASVGIALGLSGWILWAADGLGQLDHRQQLVAKWLGVLFSGFLLTNVVRWELKDRGGHGN